MQRCKRRKLNDCYCLILQELGYSLEEVEKSILAALYAAGLPMPRQHRIVQELACFQRREVGSIKKS